jgi:predicted  nucleic acid-binding Zn-ribbon protein
MSTTHVTSTLFQIQQLDLELDRLAAEQRTVIHMLQGDSKLRKLRVDYSVAQEQWQSGLQAQKEAEWTLEDVNRRLNAQEHRLFSGAVKSPKELQSLQHEVQSLKVQQIRQEEKALEMIEAADTLKETMQHKDELLQQAEDAWKAESATLVARLDQLKAQQCELQTKRVQLASRLDAALMQRYDAMRRMKQGRAVSKVEQNSCQWCRVILTPSELQRVRISVELQTCTNCGRFLHYDR